MSLIALAAVFLNEEVDDIGVCRRHNVFLIKRKTLRDISDALSIPEARFKELFRVSKDLYNYLCEELSPQLNCGSRSTKLPAHLKIQAALRFYATGSYQRGVGQDFFIAMSQTSISRIVHEVTDLVQNKLCEKWIKFPQTEEQRTINKQVFYEKTSFPNTIGAIDGTHIEILKPIRNEHLFLNRKGRHSINTQLICDFNLKILSVNAKFPGATHDSAIWESCKEKNFVSRIWSNDHSFHLIGDSGYPLQPWLITPFRSPAEDSSEMLFNNQLSKARNCIERCNGVLKARFRCLMGERKLRYEPEKAMKIINACCALHNMCLFYQVEFEDYLSNNADLPEYSNDLVGQQQPQLRQQAERIRRAIADSF